MNKIDLDYQELLKDILKNGTKKEDRTGTGTISVFGRTIRHDMKTGFPLLTTKRIKFGLIVTELLWFLQGRTDLRFLLENGCHIWTGDAYLVYDKDFDREHPAFSAPYPKRLTKEEFEKKIMEDDEFNKWYGNLGSIYGKQWRRWRKWSGKEVMQDFYEANIDEIDQIENLIHDLKTNPDSRRLLVSSWNVGEIDSMVLPPCHYGFQVYTRELSREERLNIFWKNGIQYGPVDNDVLNSDNIPTRAISLMWNQRSVDSFLGLPFNIASYGLLLEIIAKSVNMVPDELIGNLGDVHLYSNHIEQAKEQIGRELNITERVNLANNNDINISLKLGDYNFVEEKLDKLHIQKHTREPYPLPTLKHMKTEAFYKSLSEDVSLVTNLDNTDFEMENYQSHPTIKAPLSN